MSILVFFHRRNSGQIARERLKTMITAERCECSIEMLELLRHDVVQAVSRHMDIDTEELEVQIMDKTAQKTKDNITVLHVGIPLRNRKDTRKYVSEKTKSQIQIEKL